ncbi:MAG TPA: LON peptidase substrate-binding domain-containing protein [Methylomirabilota bacterium]|nr:LON peptidase substrate-binding domain-containing protein [Methylomirabilota bacterium]
MAAQVSLPIFPLPDLTFFPHTLLPLHIFEARYRAMVTDVLARDRRLAVVGLKPGYEATYEGRPPVYDVMGVGRIVQWARLATGRYNLVLRGETRARIERELPTDTLYRMVVATPLAETGGDGPDVGALAGGVKDRCRKILTAVGRSGAELQQSLDALDQPGELCDQVASAMVPTPAVRQALLEELDIARRLEKLATALDDLLSHLTGEGGRA